MINMLEIKKEKWEMVITKTPLEGFLYGNEESAT